LSNERSRQKVDGVFVSAKGFATKSQKHENSLKDELFVISLLCFGVLVAKKFKQDTKKRVSKPAHT
jgi:hypothetical protein